MMSEPTDLYLEISQIAVAFAGFGSLASALGQHKGGDDARMDAYRLQSMIVASLSAAFLGLLPATLSGLEGDTEWGLHAAAAVGIASVLIYTPQSIVRARKLRHVAGFSKRATIINSVCVLGALVAFVLCMLGIPEGRDEALYLVGLMGLLGSSGMLFTRVIVSMLIPLHRGDDDQ